RGYGGRPYGGPNYGSDRSYNPDVNYGDQSRSMSSSRYGGGYSDMDDDYGQGRNYSSGRGMSRYGEGGEESGGYRSSYGRDRSWNDLGNRSKGRGMSENWQSSDYED
ncbi:MAG TPA: hypothetical protein VIF12_07190, partial [Micavibrio sp.]